MVGWEGVVGTAGVAGGVGGAVGGTTTCGVYGLTEAIPIAPTREAFWLT